MCAPRAAFDCARDPRPTVHGRNPEIPPLGKQRELGRHLGRQLAGRHENERGRLAVGGLGALDDRQAEGEGLARAGRRFRQHVEAGERVREDKRLDREWCDDASLLERLRKVSADSERAERLLRHVVVRLLFGVRDKTTRNARRRNEKLDLTGRRDAVRAHTVAVEGVDGKKFPLFAEICLAGVLQGPCPSHRLPLAPSTERE